MREKIYNENDEIPTITEEFEPPRHEWPSGPWDNEPENRIEWRSKDGVPCLMVRGPLGAWCGYAAVAPGHPYYGRDATDWDTRIDLDVHGGVTYADFCDEGGRICHNAKPGEPEPVWWFGFDCAHHMDLVPGMLATQLRVRSMMPPTRIAVTDDDGEAIGSFEIDPFWGDVYRDIPYVREQVEHLAHQLHDAAPRTWWQRWWNRLAGLPWSYTAWRLWMTAPVKRVRMIAAEVEHTCPYCSQPRFGSDHVCGTVTPLADSSLRLKAYRIERGR